MDIRGTINYLCNLSYYDLESYAGRNFNVVYNHIKDNYDVKPNSLLIPTIFTCIASDGSLSEEEWYFVASFIGNYSYQEAIETAGEFYCAEAQDIVRGLVDKFPGFVKEAYINLCLAILCVDGNISSYESRFLNSII